MSSISNAAATGLFTYAAHSVAACLLALGACRFLRRPHDRDVVWKAAFVAPILTSAVAIALASAGNRGPFVDLGLLARHAAPGQLPGRRIRILVLQDNSGSSVDRQLNDPVTSTLSIGAIAIALGMVGGSVGRLVGRRRRLANAVADRSDVGEVSMRGGATVRLTSAPELQSPVAFSRAEICLPAEVVREFSGRHQRSLIAHEAAHLARRDPAWLFAADLIAAASAFQPLVFAVLRRFRRDVELICDEEAVRQTNDQQSLIGALALLASPFDPRSPLHGAATAYDGSPLVARAERIATLSLDVASVRVRRLTVVSVAAALALLCAAPVVSAAPRMGDFPLDPHDVRPPLNAVKRIVTVEETTTNTVRRTVLLKH